jgi:hypothetical protein
VTNEQFNKLLIYLEQNHHDLMKVFPNNIALINDQLQFSQPAKASNELFEKWTSIIDNWKRDNQIE